jgi:hypothetical protein
MRSSVSSSESAAVLALVSSNALQGYEGVFLWAVGVPWVAGFFALFGWPRASAKLAWVLPAVPVLVGLFVWVLASVLAGVS